MVDPMQSVALLSFAGYILSEHLFWRRCTFYFYCLFLLFMWQGEDLCISYTGLALSLTILKAATFLLANITKNQACGEGSGRQVVCVMQFSWDLAICMWWRVGRAQPSESVQA